MATDAKGTALNAGDKGTIAGRGNAEFKIESVDVDTLTVSPLPVKLNQPSPATFTVKASTFTRTGR